MTTKYRVDVFGKQGCDKCGVLNQRLDKLLADPAWADFEKHYWDVETEPGMVAFSEAETLNPQRIPAMLVMRWDEALGEYEPIPNPAAGTPDPLLKDSALFAYIGLQTDYSDRGKGLISPKMISTCLETAAAIS